METGMAIGLGLLRGLTECMPISWEGHLAFLRMISGMAAPSSVVELCLHLGLLAALLLCYGKRLVSMFAHPLQSELKWLILSVIILKVLMDGLDGSMLNIALPSIG